MTKPITVIRIAACRTVISQMNQKRIFSPANNCPPSRQQSENDRHGANHQQRIGGLNNHLGQSCSQQRKQTAEPQFAPRPNTLQPDSEKENHNPAEQRIPDARWQQPVSKNGPQPALPEAVTAQGEPWVQVVGPREVTDHRYQSHNYQNDDDDSHSRREWPNEAMPEGFHASVA